MTNNSISSSSSIHPTAIISDSAIIGDNSEIGPYCVIGDNVVIGNNVILKSHIVVENHTEIGDGCVIFSFASIGLVPQDLKYKGEPAKLIIGKNNTIREYVTINIGTESGGMLTKIGDNNLLMIGVHIAHDCIVGNNIVMANNATLAGHVVVEDNVVIGGLSAVHQFVRIGKNAMIGGMSGVENDVIPFGTVMGERASLCGLNLVGLKRNGFSKEEINILRDSYKKLFEENNSKTMQNKIDELKKQYPNNITVNQMFDFITIESNRGLCLPKS